MPGNKSKWDLTGFSQVDQGKSVPVFDAFGLTHALGPATYPKLEPGLAQEAAQYGVPMSQFAPQANTGPQQNGSGNAGGAPPAIGSCNAAQTGANKKLMQQKAAAYGWTGAEWDALDKVMMSESGYCNTIKNPTSTAYGIGQFLDSTWATVGGHKTSDASTQIDLTLKYIKQRYKTPSAAWAFHQAHNWY